MVVIVDNVTSKNESNELIVKAAKGIKRDIKDLLGCAQDS